jgi:hypothetical protein
LTTGSSAEEEKKKKREKKRRDGHQINSFKKSSGIHQKPQVSPDDCLTCVASVCRCCCCCCCCCIAKKEQ